MRDLWMETKNLIISLSHIFHTEAASALNLPVKKKLFFL